MQVKRKRVRERKKLISRKGKSIWTHEQVIASEVKAVFKHQTGKTS